MEKIRGGDVRAAGVPDGPAMGVALSCIPRAVKQLGREGALARLAEVAAHRPSRFQDEVHFGALAQRLVADQREADRRFVERDAPAPLANYCARRRDRRARADAQLAAAAERAARRADARRAPRLRAADRRRAGDRGHRDPVRRRGGHRLPDEALGARPGPGRRSTTAGAPGAGAAQRDAVRHRRQAAQARRSRRRWTTSAGRSRRWPRVCATRPRGSSARAAPATTSSSSAC